MSSIASIQRQGVLHGHSCRYYKENCVHILGYDYGADFLEIQRSGDYALWYKKSVSVYVGRMSPRATSNAIWALVKLTKTDANKENIYSFEVIEAEEPGKNWRKCKQALIEKMNELSNLSKHL